MAIDRTKANRAIRQLLDDSSWIDDAMLERFRTAFNASLEGPETVWKIPVLQSDDDPILVLDLTINEGEN